MKRFFLLISIVLLASGAYAAVIEVAPGSTNLSYTVVSNSAAGDTIVLSTGEYAEPYSFDVNKAGLVIMAAEGASPVIKSSSYMNFYATTTFKGIKFDGQNTAEYVIYYRENTAKNAVFEDCEFTGYTKYCLTGSGSGHLDSLILENVYFHDCGSAVYVPHGSLDGVAGCSYFKMVNSTLANITQSQSAGGVDVRGYGSSYLGVEFVMDHVTFYNFVNTNSSPYEHMVQSYKSPGCTITNSIFANPSGSYYAQYCYSGAAITNCLYYNTRDHSGPTITGKIEGDPLFVDAANLNFMLQSTSPAIGAATDGTNLGDPRWGVQSNSFGIVLNSPEENISATDSYRISFLATDPAGTGTVTLQYKTGTGDWTDIVAGLALSTVSYDWNIRTMAAGEYTLRAILANTSDQAIDTAAGVLTIVPDTEAPRVVREFTGVASGSSVDLTWINPDQSVALDESFATLDTTNTAIYISNSGEAGTSVPVYSGDTATVAYTTSSSWIDTGIKVAVPAMADASTFSFMLKGDGSSNCIRVYIEQNGFDWWYVNLYPGASFAEQVITNPEKIGWHNNLSDATFSGKNVTAIYFVASNGEASTSGTFAVAGLRIQGTLDPVADYAGTVIVRSTTAYPASATDGEVIYNGTASAYTDAITPSMDYYYAAFAYDDLMNYSVAATWKYEGSGVPSALENVGEQTALDWNEPVYNVLGQRVPEGTKGVLIQNGVKYVVR